jgi:dipeptidyl aminopeptidase/acylaminoacyl peptidase
MLYMGTMVWNEKGDALIAGSRVRHGAPVIWHASGVRCDPPSSDRRSPTPGAEWEKQRLPPATGPAGNGLITFSRDGDIYVGDPATGETMPIVTGPQFDTEPKFSPDGSLIAFTRYVDEGERVTDPPSNPLDYGHADPSDVHVVRPDGSDERAIEGTNSTEDLGPDGQRIFVDWTPDSQGLVVSHFWSNFRDDETARSGEGLTWFDPSGAAAPRLLTPPLPLHPVGNAGRSYAYGDGEMAGLFRPPEGDRLLSADWTGGPPLAAIDPDGSNVEVLIDRSWMVESGYDVVADASWSPDASMIAFSTSGPGGVTGSYVMGADGSDLRQLAGSGPWSPDSSRIAVVGASVPLDDGGPGHRLTIVDVATGAERELDPVMSVSGLSWSPDGRSLLVMPHRGTRLVLVDAETGIATELPWETDPWYSWQRVAVD